MSRAPFVVLEGAEGVGKSTQLARLVSRLERDGVPVVAIREPGSTPLGNEIRRLLLSTDLAIGARAEALLFMAARSQLVDDVVLAAREQGAVVLADRFFLSTYAYQIAGRELPEAAVRTVNAFAVRDLRPDLTLLLDLTVEVGLERARVRGAADRMEREAASFHNRVADAFREFAASDWQAQHPECGPIVRVPAGGSESDVFDRIWAILSARWPATFCEAGRSNQ